MWFASIELQKTMELRAHEQRRATLMQQPLQCNLHPGQNLLQNRISAPKPKKVWCWSLFKRNCKGKWNAPKTKKSTKKYVATSTHFVRDFLQNLKVQLVKRKLLCETSLKNWKLSMWKGSFCARHPQETVSWTCANEAFVQYFPQKLKS